MPSSIASDLTTVYSDDFEEEAIDLVDVEFDRDVVMRDADTRILEKNEPYYSLATEAVVMACVDSVLEDDDILTEKSTQTVPCSSTHVVVLGGTPNERRRIRVLEVLCGFRRDAAILNSICRIQSFCREFLVASRTCERFVVLCRQYLASVARRTEACRVIQACVRGSLARQTPLGRAVGAVGRCRREVIDLELLVLSFGRVKRL